MNSMTGKQRFMAALRGEPVDRPPAASIVSVINYELMDKVELTFSGRQYRAGSHGEAGRGRPRSDGL